MGNQGCCAQAADDTPGAIVSVDGVFLATAPVCDSKSPGRPASVASSLRLNDDSPVSVNGLRKGDGGTGLAIRSGDCCCAQLADGGRRQVTSVDVEAGQPMLRPELDPVMTEDSLIDSRLVLPAPTFDEDGPCVTIHFRKSNGDEEIVSFFKRPLGMEFHHSKPMSVKRVRPKGRAARSGVQEGWTLSSVNGIDLACIDPSEANVIMKEVVKRLPEQDTVRRSTSNLSRFS